VILAIYVDDVNIFGNKHLATMTAALLEQEFEMKDLGETSYCIGLQIESAKDGSKFVHQTTYTRKILTRFNMDKAHPLSTPMMVRHLDPTKDPFRPAEEEEKILGPETPYVAAIGALLYLATCTRPDISFAVNLLARFSKAPVERHWQGVKHLLRYLRGTENYGLYYDVNNKDGLVGYADAGYLSDPHKARSQTGYVYLYNGTAISWKSTKQTLVATSTNLAEIYALHEASKEGIWLRRLTHHILETSGLPVGKKATNIFEDNHACVEQMNTGFQKSDRTKHIDPKFFYTHELILSKEITVTAVASKDNIADIFTKALPAYTHRHLRNLLGLRSKDNVDLK
jgi:hypothetical protein